MYLKAARVYMYYLHQLVNGPCVCYYIDKQLNYDYNCEHSIVKRGGLLECKAEWKIQGMAGRCWYPGCGAIITYRGEAMEQIEVARSLGLCLNTFKVMLHRIHRWKIPWWKECREFINGEIVKYPEFRDGRMVRDSRIKVNGKTYDCIKDAMENNPLDQVYIWNSYMGQRPWIGEDGPV